MVPCTSAACMEMTGGLAAVCNVDQAPIRYASNAVAEVGLWLNREFDNPAAMVLELEDLAVVSMHATLPFVAQQVRRDATSQ